jgi:hypothetical protein
MSSSLIENLSKDVLNILSKQFRKDKNKGKIKHITNMVFGYVFDNISIYLYTILIILIIIFIMNCVQFYYYMAHIRVLSLKNA